MSYDQNDARIVNQSTATVMHWALLFVATDPQFNQFNSMHNQRKGEMTSNKQANFLCMIQKIQSSIFKSLMQLNAI